MDRKYSAIEALTSQENKNGEQPFQNDLEEVFSVEQVTEYYLDENSPEKLEQTQFRTKFAEECKKTKERLSQVDYQIEKQQLLDHQHALLSSLADRYKLPEENTEEWSHFQQIYRLDSRVEVYRLLQDALQSGQWQNLGAEISQLFSMNEESSIKPEEIILLDPTYVPFVGRERFLAEQKKVGNQIKRFFSNSKKNHLIEEIQNLLTQEKKQLIKELETVLETVQKYLSELLERDVLLLTADEVALSQRLHTLLNNLNKKIIDLELSTPQSQALHAQVEETSSRFKTTIEQKIRDKVSQLDEEIQGKAGELVPGLDTIPKNLTEESQRFALSELEELEKVILGSSELSKTAQEDVLQRIAALKEKIKANKWKKMRIYDATYIRGKIHRKYQKLLSESQNEDEKRKAKEFLTQALRVVEELTHQQVESFIHSFEEVWERLETTEEDGSIVLEDSAVEEVFKKNGFVFDSRNSGILDSFRSMVESHNKLIKVFKKLGVQSNEDGQFIYRKLLHADKESYQFHGKVMLDFRSPIIAIRLNCHDRRDYTYFTEGDFEDVSFGKTYHHAGMSFTDGFNITIEGENFSVPVIVNDVSQTDRSEEIQTHENAHQKILVRDKYGAMTLARDRDVDKAPTIFTHKEEVLQEPLAWYQKRWRDTLQSDFNWALSSGRDELQAYTEDGSDFDDILETLTDDSEDALYNYVGNTAFLEAQTKHIRANSELSEEQKERLIVELSQDAEKAKKAYHDALRDAVTVLKRLDQSMPESKNKRRKLATLMRFTTMKEWKYLARYLDGYARTEEKKEENELRNTVPRIIEQLQSVPQTEEERGMIEKATTLLEKWLHEWSAYISEKKDIELSKVVGELRFYRLGSNTISNVDTRSISKSSWAIRDFPRISLFPSKISLDFQTRILKALGVLADDNVEQALAALPSYSDDTLHGAEFNRANRIANKLSTKFKGVDVWASFSNEDRRIALNFDLNVLSKMISVSQ